MALILLSGENSDSFLIRDAHQLKQLRGNFIYLCAHSLDLRKESGAAEF